MTSTFDDGRSEGPKVESPRRRVPEPVSMALGLIGPLAAVGLLLWFAGRRSVGSPDGATFEEWPAETGELVASPES